MRISEDELGQGSEQWLAWRRLGIGGSEIYALACYADSFAEAWGMPELARLKPRGVMPSWVTDPNVLAMRKLGLMPEQPSNFHMRRGKRLEPEARSAAAERYGMEFPPFCLSPDNLPAVRVSLDGFNDKHGMLIEIKAPAKPWTHTPDYLEYQTAYQVEALRLEAGDAHLVRTVKGLTIRETGGPRGPVEVRAWRLDLWRDRGFCQALTKLAAEFYRRCVEQVGI